MTVVEGDLVVEDELDLAAFAGVEEITGDLVLGGLAWIELPALQVVHGDIRVGDELSPPTSSSLLETLRLPALREIGGSFDPNSHDASNDRVALRGIALDSLARVGGDFLVHDHPLDAFELPLLEDVRGRLAVENVNSLGLLDLDALVEAGDLRVHAGVALTTLRLGSLERVEAQLSVRVENVASLGLPSLTHARTLSIVGGGGCDLALDATDLIRVEALELSCIAGNYLYMLGYVDVTDRIRITSMPELEAVNLHNQDAVLSSLYLGDNASLAYLEYTEIGTRRIDVLEVIDNPVLCASQIAAFASARTVGSSTVTGNDDGC